MRLYIIAAVVICLGGLFGTLAVAFSKGNQNEDNSYSKRKKSNIIRIILFNAMFVVVLFIILLVHIRYFT